MKEFSKLCKEFEEMDVLSYSMIYSGKQQVQQTPLVGAFQEGERICRRP